MSLFASLEAVHLRFTLVFRSAGRLPAYKGSTFHGGFGRALEQVAPPLYRELFDPQDAAAAQALPKPFVLLPPLEPRRDYKPGDLISCELLLIGRAIRHLSVCVCAMDRLGRMGLGKDLAHFDIGQVDILGPDEQSEPLYDGATGCWGQFPTPLNGDQTIAATPVPDSQPLTLEFQTRVRLQADNRLVKGPPPFPLFLGRLLGRLNMLAWASNGSVLVDQDNKRRLLEQAATVAIHAHQLVWDDWSRYSDRQQAWMKFGGLLGQITYGPGLQPFLPYLKLGAWLHVGGKTSFGLGKYRLVT